MATASTSTATSDTTCRSVTAFTSASARHWRDSRDGLRSTRCCSASRSGRSIGTTPRWPAPQPCAVGKRCRCGCERGPPMLLELSPDQEFFRETTAKFLNKYAPVDELRRLRDDTVGFDRDYWRRGAELGWTSLLVDEAHGGGSVSGSGVVDLTLIAHEFGHSAAPGPLVTTNLAAAALNDASAHLDVLAGLLSGESIASWCLSEPSPADPLCATQVEVRRDGDDVVVNGTKRPVEAGGVA